MPLLGTSTLVCEPTVSLPSLAAPALSAISPARVGGPPEVKSYWSPICCSGGR